jgi:mono/diheme cytochrome c family protein
LLAAGCDDEVTNAPDGGAKDGSATADGGGTAGDAPTAGDTGGTTADAAVDAAAGDTASGTMLTTQQARGQYLVDHVVACPDCHTPRDAMGAPLPGKYLSGAKCFIMLPNGDCLHTRNLTNHATGLKNRTADEIKNMFQNGIRPPATSGGSTDAGSAPTALNPVMPYYVFHNMDADDADAIVAYLRTVPGVENELPPRGASFDVPGPAPYLDPNKIPLPKADAPNQESAMHGRYLTSKIGLCIECHTQHNAPGPGDVLMTAKFFQGGEMFPFPQFPVVPVSKNLTSDPATGLGNWTVDQILTVLKQGKDKDGKGICPPMPVGPMGAYGGLTDQDARDIANYIKSLPPATNMIVDMCSFPFPPPPATDGGMSPADGGNASDAPASTDGAASGG